MGNSLKDKTLNAGIITIFGQVIGSIVNFAKGIILARILLPEDFGIVASIVAIANFANLLIDAGLSTVIIQRKEISNDQISFIFISNIVIGVLLFTIFQIIVPLIGMFYHNMEIVSFARAYFFIFILSAIYPVHLAVFKRNLKFKIPILIQLCSQVFSLVVGIVLALYQYGAWSLVFMMIANHLSTAVLSVKFSNLKINISRHIFNGKNMQLLYNGFSILGFNMINYFSRNLDQILIARTFAPFQLGLYSKSYEIALLPINQIRGPFDSVALPVLRSLKDLPQRYKFYYANYLKGLLFITWSVILGVILFETEIIEILLGNHWIKMKGVFLILLINALIQPIAGTRGTVMLSIGDNKRYFYWGFVNAIFTICSFFIGVQFSIEMVALSYTVYNFLIVIPSLKYCFKNSYLSWKDFFNITTLLQIKLLSVLFVSMIILNLTDDLIRYVSLFSYILGILLILFTDSDLKRTASLILNKIYEKKNTIKRREFN